MNFRLEQPWYLLLVAVVVFGWLACRRRESAVAYGDVGLLDIPAPSSLRLRLASLPDCLRALGLTLLVFALARPRTAEQASATYPPGIAWEFVLDVSGSMGVEEGIGTDGPIDRLDRVGRMVLEFLDRITEDPARRNDPIGVIAFSRDPRILCPLTTDHATVQRAVRTLEVDRLESRTNLGDALALAIDRLRKSGVREQAILLCSDGAHNVENALPPGEGARIAQTLGIRVDALAVGATAGNEGPDETTLRRIAETTGGRFFRSTDAASYSDLARRLADSAREPAPRQGDLRWRDAFPIVLLAALLVWLVELLLRTTWLRITPALDQRESD